MAPSKQMTTADPPVLSLSEVRRHNSGSDCWIIVHSKVYDVSAFHPEHPGGSAIILKFAGADATTAYDEIHAPGILEQTLPHECCLGLLDPIDVEKHPDAQETATVQIHRSVEHEGSLALHKTSAYTKPELFKLISAHDFEDVARNTFTAKAFAFYSSAATDLVTHHSNSEFYKRIMIRPRIMRNVKEVSMRRKIMGCDSSAPFFVSPAAMARLAHPDGELAIVQGCDAEGIILTVSHHPGFVSISTDLNRLRSRRMPHIPLRLL
jgi:L-lactate dehydrogenase (cytochrome)